LARRRLDLVYKDFLYNLDEAERLTFVIAPWHGLREVNGVRQRVNNFYDLVLGLAFLRGFLAWEQFLENSFILYSLGKASPNGFSPNRYIIPRSREHAISFSKGDKIFCKWDDLNFILGRANKFFRDGKPFHDPLRSRTTILNNIKTLRNAVTHQSSESQEKFEIFVRGELGYYPKGLTPGGFLAKLISNSSPAAKYIEFYFSILRSAAKEIIPS
jgi:hypothetical protein